MLGCVSSRLRVVKREARPPLDVADERSAKLRIVGEARVVCGEAHQGGEAEALLTSDREPAVVGEHVLVPPVVRRVVGGAAEDLAPPGGHVRAVLLADAAWKHRRKELIRLDAVVESIDQSPQCLLTARPLVQSGCP